ncbi:TetR/AcrR family transcriptional regulator [Myxococcus fulvus]|uniref:TetR/AcrR family transcriptional regulator n=1 Tax=Myxococcus fulvus TaxID=33 RepID=UPI003B9BFB53
MSTHHRTAILTAAAQHFAQLGFTRVSLEDIARRAGLEHGQVSRHFSTKEALFIAVVRQHGVPAMEALERAVARAPSPEQQVRTFVEVRQEQTERILRELNVSFDALLDILPLIDLYVADLHARELALLESVFTEGTRRGDFHFQSPRNVAAAMLASLREVERLTWAAQCLTASGPGRQSPDLLH